MKTIKRIQNIMVVVGLFTVIHLADGEDYTTRDFWAAMVIIVLILSMIIYRVAIEEQKRKKEEV